MILKILKLLICYFCTIALSVLADDKTTLIVGYGDHNSAPYAIESGERLSAGIIKDIATELSGELDINITFIKTPKTLLAL